MNNGKNPMLQEFDWPETQFCDACDRTQPDVWMLKIRHVGIVCPGCADDMLQDITGCRFGLDKCNHEICKKMEGKRVSR